MQKERFQEQKVQNRGATQKEQDAQAEVNQDEEDPQASGQTLQTPQIKPTEEEMQVEASTAAIGQRIHVLEKKVYADLKVLDVEEPPVAAHQANQA